MTGQEGGEGKRSALEPQNHYPPTSKTNEPMTDNQKTTPTNASGGPPGKRHHPRKKRKKKEEGKMTREHC